VCVRFAGGMAVQYNGGGAMLYSVPTRRQFVIRYQRRGRGVGGGSAIVVGGRAANITLHRPS